MSYAFDVECLGISNVAQTKAGAENNNRARARNHSQGQTERTLAGTPNGKWKNVNIICRSASDALTVCARAEGWLSG